MALLELLQEHRPDLLFLGERHHDDRFVALMDKHLPQWRARQQELNAAPLANETWEY